MLKIFFKWIKRIIIFFFVGSILIVLIYRFIPVHITPLMIIRSGEHILSGEFPRIHKKWMPLDEISPNMFRAVMAGEDQNFINHNGFDFKAMEKAYKYNKRGKKIRGGSTISQQTAKNVFLVPWRSYVRKVLEAYFTLLIEIFWTKERIMEVYLNVIETGDGIYGVEMAAQRCFKKSAKKLNAYEAATIAATLPNPRKFKCNKSSNYINKRKSFILKYISHMPKTLD